jgi:hypothetical protein
LEPPRASDSSDLRSVVIIGCRLIHVITKLYCKTFWSLFTKALLHLCFCFFKQEIVCILSVN